MEAFPLPSINTLVNYHTPTHFALGLHDWLKALGMHQCTTSTHTPGLQFPR